MAVKEELIIEARAETGDAEQGLARVAKAATALADAEEGLATSGVAASDSVDDLGNATKAADKQLEGAADSAKEFSDQVDRAAKEAAAAKTQFGAAGTEAAKAGDKMSSASTEGKKFTDMLREVGDGADVAAGKIAEGLGGPGFVKALGGAAIGIAGAKAGVEAFLDSSEALFRSYGPEGQAVWDETEKSLFAIKGAFAEAVIGGGSVEEMGSRLESIFEGVKVAVTLLLSPVSAFSGAIRALATDQSESALASGRMQVAEIAYAKAMDGTNTAITTAQQGYEGVQRTIIAMLGTKKELALFDLKQQANTILAAVQLQENADFQRRLAAGNLAADQAEAEYRLKKGETFMVAYRTIAEKGVEEARNAARGSALRRINEEEKGVDEQITRMRDALLLLDEERENIENGTTRIEEGTPTTPSRTGSSKPLKEAEDLMLKVQDLGDGMFKILSDSEAEAAQAAADAAGSNATVFYEIKQSEYKNLAQMKEEHDFAMLGVNTLYDNALLAAQAERIAAEKAAQKAADDEKTAEARKLAEAIAAEWSKFGDASEALGLQNLENALSGIGTALGQTAAAGGDFGDAMGATMEALVGQIAGQWGDLFLKQGIGLMFLDPIAGAGLLAAGIGLKALSGFMSGGDTTTDTGSTGASGVQESATAATTVARPESSFGYFEGGRSPVTIVTNDAASIRTMQHRLDFVSARGGSGV